MKTNALTLSDALDALKAKQISAKELFNDCLGQIKQYDNQLNSFLSINQTNPPSQTKGKLAGIPIAVKDNFLTTDLTTTASSNALKDYQPHYESTVTHRLKQAGATIIGKNNLDAWAHGSSTETSDFGPTKNPWNLNHLPGGSSGGTAAAVSADMAIAGIGSETAGSIRQPSAWCGVVGLKPTYSRVSRYGVIAMGSSLDSPGPITKTVKDAALLLNIIAGHDPLDATSSPQPVPDYTKTLDQPIKGLKIALGESYFVKGIHPKVKQAVLSAAKKLEELGAVVEAVDSFDPTYAVAVYTIVQRSEVSSNLARYDGIRYGNNRSHFGLEAKRRIMLGTHVLSSGYYDAYYKKAQAVRALYIQDFDKIFSKYDCLLTPTSPAPAKKLGATRNQAMFGELEDILLEPSSLSGLPGINVPAGFVDGLPIGLNLVGPKFSEPIMLQLAHAYQQATSWHTQKPPLINS